MVLQKQPSTITINKSGFIYRYYDSNDGTNKRKYGSNPSTNKTLEERLLDFATVYLHATMDIDMKNFMKDAKLSLSEEQLKELKNAEDNMYDSVGKSAR